MTSAGPAAPSARSARSRIRKKTCSARPENRWDAADGFTLIELLVVIVIMGILATTTVWGLRAYQRSQDESGTARDVMTSLRDVAERAQSEGRTYCVSFDSATSWSVWRTSCLPGFSNGTNTALQVSPGQQVHGNSQLTGASFAASVNAGTCPAPAIGCAYFYPRGTASAGQITVTRPDSSLQYLIKVEGLTGRVYIQ